MTRGPSHANDRAGSARRMALAGAAALAGIPILGGAGARPSALAAEHGSQALRLLFGTGATSVLSCGAIGDGVHDDTDAFMRACAEIPLNGAVIVPRTSAFYRVRQSIPLASRSLIGIGWPTLVLSTTDPTMDLLQLRTADGSYDDWHQSSVVSGLVLSTSHQGRDLLRIFGGNTPQLRDLRLIGAGRDGLHVEGGTTGEWTESLCAMNVFASTSGRDNFHLAISEDTDISFVNQTSFLNCKSRGPGRYALACVNRNHRGGDNAKISELSWINGELDGSGGQADDIVLLRSDGPGIVECISFYDTAIEDVNARHPGYAVRLDPLDGGRIGSVRLLGCIAYGAASGAINRVDTAESVKDRGRTKTLSNGEAEAIFEAPPGGFLKIVAFGATEPGNPSSGEWTVFENSVVALAQAGCTLSASQRKLVLANTSVRPASFSWCVQRLG